MSQDRSEEHQPHYNRGTPLPYLREIRQSRGLSQRELGELARVSSGTVYRVETGLRGTYPGTVRKLATALRVAPETLLYGKNAKRLRSTPIVQRAPEQSIPTGPGKTVERSSAIE